MVVAPFFNLTKDENTILKPLKDAHKRQGTYWERAYQAVKHDRYSSLQKGNVKAFLQALAALYLLNIYYRNDSWVTKYRDIKQLDYSLGSSIFMVKPPTVDLLWYGNKPIVSESPYVVTYQDSDYKNIEEMQQNEEKALNDYLNNQPELQEVAFQNQLKEALKKAKQNDKVVLAWELTKYRLHKLIPNNLPFEEKKSRLVNSEGWNCWIHKNNKHLSEEELTEENIQHEIDTVATCWGMQIMKKYQKLEWIPIAMNSEICNIYIP